MPPKVKKDPGGRQTLPEFPFPHTQTPSVGIGKDLNLGVQVSHSSIFGHVSEHQALPQDIFLVSANQITKPDYSLRQEHSLESPKPLSALFPKPLLLVIVDHFHGRVAGHNFS